MSLLLLLGGGVSPDVIATPVQGDQPVACLRISQDGGKTWGNERCRSTGAKGQWQTRVIWTRCGSGRRWMPEFVVSDPVPWKILGAMIDVTKEKT